MDFTIDGKAHPWIGGTLLAIVCALILFFGLDTPLLVSLLAFPASYALTAMEHFKMARASKVVSIIALGYFLMRGIYLFADGKPMAGLWFVIGFVLFVGAELYIRRAPIEK